MKRSKLLSVFTSWIALANDRRKSIVMITVASLLSFVLAGMIMSGWTTHIVPTLDAPYIYAGDGFSHLWMIQRVIEGWIFNNDRSGFPFGSNFLDYPNSDAGSLLVLKFLGWLTGSYYGAADLYFLLGFPAALISAYLVGRAFDLRRPYALAAAVLFAFAPYHFSRLLMGHVFYTFYFPIPIYFYLGMRVYGASQREFLLSIKGNIGVGLGMLALASFGVYFAFFGILVIVISAIVGSLANGAKAPLRTGLFLICMIVLGVAAELTPNVLHIMSKGENAEVAQRSPIESEIYGLKIMHLLLPQPNHRITKFAEFTNSYDRGFPLSNTTSSLGFLGIIGFCILIARLFSSKFVNPEKMQLRIHYVAIIFLSLLLIATVGGLSSLFALLISPLIRGWDRISIFLFFAAQLGLFLGIQHAKSAGWRWVPKTHWGEITFATALAVVGFLDQTPSSYQSITRNARINFVTDRNFIGRIEKSMPEGSAIYQLPYMPFPEGAPKGTLGSYTLLGGFLNSHSLKWSFGGMKGRDGDAVFRKLSAEPISKQVTIARKMGFSGIYVDLRGYDDHGAKVVASLEQVLGKQPLLTRADGQVVFFYINNLTQ